MIKILHLKVACIILLIPLLIALILLPSPHAKKIASLSECYTNKSIGHLPAPIRKEFEREVLLLCKAAGVTEEISINKHWKKGCLNIMVTTRQAKSVTNCDIGNAIFDASINTIFIDTNLISMPGLANIASEKASSDDLHPDIPVYGKVYLHFVLLHELGHYVEHRELAESFDVSVASSPNKRQLESEADSFALGLLLSAYKQYPTLVPEDSKRLELDGYSDTDKIAKIILISLDVLNQISFFSKDLYTTLYEDSAHPNFTVRSSAMINELKDKIESMNIKTLVRSTQESLNLTQPMKNLDYQEINSSFPIWTVRLSESSMYGIAQDGAAAQIELKELRSGALDKSRSAIHINNPALLPGDADKHPGLVPKKENGVVFAWHNEDEGLTVLLGNNFYCYRDEKWRRADKLTENVVNDLNKHNISLGTSKGLWPDFLNLVSPRPLYDPDDFRQFLLDKRGQSYFGVIEHCDAPPCFFGDSVYVPFAKQHSSDSKRRIQGKQSSHVYSIKRIDGRTGKAEEFINLQDGDGVTAEFGKLAIGVCESPKSQKAHLFRINGNNLETWSLQNSSKKTHLASTTISYVESKEIYISPVCAITGKGYVVSLVSGPLMFFDIRNDSWKTLFPSNELTRFRATDKGEVVIYTENCTKLFFIKL